MARSGSSSSALTGRGAPGQAVAARRPARAARAEAAAERRSGTTGPTTRGPAPKRPANRSAALSGSSVPPSTTTSRRRWTPASQSGRLLAVDLASDDRHRGGRPVQGGRPRVQRFLGLAAGQRAPDQGLEAGVPGAASLGGAGVDLGRAERDLARVAEHGFA